MGVTKTTLTPGDGKNFPKAVSVADPSSFMINPAASNPIDLLRGTQGDQVSMHYVGTLDNGKKFDSSRDRGQPFVTKIGVGQVIKGWDEGVPQMSLGERATLNITYDYAYGERGHPAGIPPKANLTFEVELLKIN
ncbi:FK506 binding protein proline rotamase rapamycin-binding protein [Geranomyces michiganensis]|nr:FK506 binding protein proline rotamase rapamycin-binding protein [Geranomyces michiganensis]